MKTARVRYQDGVLGLAQLLSMKNARIRYQDGVLCCNEECSHKMGF